MSLQLVYTLADATSNCALCAALHCRRRQVASPLGAVSSALAAAMCAMCSAQFAARCALRAVRCATCDVRCAMWTDCCSAAAAAACFCLPLTPPRRFVMCDVLLQVYTQLCSLCAVRCALYAVLCDLAGVHSCAFTCVLHFAVRCAICYS